jgi:hypothetical protein
MTVHFNLFQPSTPTPPILTLRMRPEHQYIQNAAHILVISNIFDYSSQDIMGILRSQSFVLGTIYSGCQRYYALTT